MIEQFHNWMMRSCYDESCREFEFIGGRGIEVFPAWHHLHIFAIDAQPLDHGLELARLDRNEHFTPTNCFFTDWIDTMIPASDEPEAPEVTSESQLWGVWSRGQWSYTVAYGELEDVKKDYPGQKITSLGVAWPSYLIVGDEE